MANPNFIATMSSNEIWRDLDDTRCITDDLDTIEADILELEQNKADADHTHSGYAPTSHSHSEYAPTSHQHTGYAASVHGHSYNDLSDKPTIPSAYTHPASHPASMITGLATVATSGNYSDLNGKPTIPTIPASLPANGGNADTVDGKHATDFATADHNHDSAYSAKALQITTDTGAFKYSYKVEDGKNLLDEIATLNSGVHTVYSQAGVSGNPKTTEAWRFMVHKTGSTAIWVIGFGSYGSVYTNYYNGNSEAPWQGWRCIYDYAPVPLWTGDRYMAATHTATPTKKLSECNHGWVLLWSDYNAGESVQNLDFATTVITKRRYDGAAWNGEQWLCSVPRYAQSDSDASIIKALHIYDDRIVGDEINNVSPRNDVVLRAIYEY